jgi:hypothetical protein
MKRLSILLLKMTVVSLVAPWLANALMTGGASSPEEMKQIEARVPAVQTTCNLQEQLSSVTRETAQNIGRNLLFNETSCKVKELASWDSTEDFPSIGIPHVIWFPSGVEKKYDESFPRFWKYLRERNNGAMKMPSFLDRDDITSGSVPSIWQSKQQFDSDPRVKELNRFLANPTVLGWESDFAIHRGFDAAYKVMATNSLDPKPKMSTKVMCQHFKKLLSSPGGVMALVDYTNFKGEGIYPAEIKGPSKVRWGLKQVIETMDDPNLNLSGEQISKVQSVLDPKQRDLDLERQKFASAAKQTLSHRLENDPSVTKKVADEDRSGWGNRIDRTYMRDGIQPQQCPIMSGSPTAGSQSFTGGIR